MANKETRIYKTDTLETLRQKSNEISLHLGDNEQLNSLMADKTYVYSAAAGDTLFAGADTSSPAKTARFEVSPTHTVDNTGGYIVLKSVSSLDSSYIPGNIIYQGTSGSASYSATIVSASTDRILVRDSSGNFSTSTDLKVGTGSPDVIAHANIERIVIEANPVGIVRVYKNGTELNQAMVTNGFHVADIRATITHTGSPTLTDFTRGVTIYQGSSQSTQAGVEANADWYGTLHSVSGGVIRVKTYNGNFITSGAGSSIRALGSSNTITSHGSLTAIDNTYGSYIELTTPASSSDQIKVFSLDVVAAINELQDDIGGVESLTTAANNLVLAINEHDAELGTITASAMGTAASTVSTAIREHEDQIGNESISSVDAEDSNNTITGALNQLHAEVGDVTSTNLGTSASNLTAAIREHEDQIGNDNINAISSTNNTIKTALNQLHTEIGSSVLTDNLPTDFAYNVTDHTTATNTMSSFIGNTSIANIGTTDTVTGALQKLHAELGSSSITDNLPTDITYTVTNHTTALNTMSAFIGSTSINNIGAPDTLTGALQSLHGEIGNMVFGSSGPVDTVNSTTLTGAVNVLDAEIGNTNYNSVGTDISTALLNLYNDIYTTASVTGLNTTATHLVGAINELEQDLFNAEGGTKRTRSSLLTSDKTSIVDAINELHTELYTSGASFTGLSANNFKSAINELRAELGDVNDINNATGYSATTAVTGITEIQGDIGNVDALTLEAGTIVGALNEIEAIFDASTREISASSDPFTVTSGSFLINSSGNIVFDNGTNHTVLKKDGVEYARFTKSGTDFQLKAGHLGALFLTASGQNATFANNLTVDNNLEVDGTAGVDGNFRVGVSGSSRFTVAASNGNTSVGGTLGVTGNTTLGGTLGVTGATTLSSTLNVTGAAELVSSLGVDGNLRVGSNKFNVTASNGNTQIDGTLEVDGSTGIDGNFRVGAEGASKFTVTASNGNTTVYGTLGVSQHTSVSSLSASGNASVGGTLGVTGATTLSSTLNVTGATELDSTLGVDGNLRVGNNKFNVTATSGNTQIDGTLEVDGSVGIDGNFRIGSNSPSPKFNVTSSSGNTTIGGTLGVDGNTTIAGTTTITNTTQSSVSSATDGALIVAGGVSIGKNLYVGGNLQVEGTQTILNTETLTVEDTLVLAGNNLSSEPTTGGFGLEVGPITSPSGVASNVTGAHSIVYNYATDRWEADGSLILSTATLATPQVEGVDFGPSDNLTFNAGVGLSETVTKTGATIVTQYVNTDRGSVAAAALNIFSSVVPSSGTTATADNNNDALNLTQGTGISTVGDGDNVITITNTDRGSVAASALRMFKTISLADVPDSTNADVVADSNADILKLRALDAITLTSDSNNDIISIDHDDFGTAGTYGPDVQDGEYIKSITVNSQGHVTAITTDDFDTRYEASDPTWALFNNTTKIDDVASGDTVKFIGGNAIDLVSSHTSGTSTLQFNHANTSSVSSLSSDNSGGNVLQDISLTFDTYGHVTARSIGTVNLDNRYIRSFQVEDGDGTEVTINQANEWKFVEGSGTGATIDINWTDTSNGSNTDPYDLTFTVNNTDRGSVAVAPLRIFKYVASDSGTAEADSAADTLTIAGGTNINTAVVGDTLTINNEYVYNHPTYNGDDFSIDTGLLSGATVISDLDINVTTDTLGHVVDANGTVATRTLIPGDLGIYGWDLHENGSSSPIVNNILNDQVDFVNGNHTTAVVTNPSANNGRVTFNHNTFTSGGTFVGGANNGIVIEDFYIDSYGHVRSVGTRDLDGRYDKYDEWRIQDNGDSTTQYGKVSSATEDSTGYVKFINGTNTTTERGGSGTVSDPHTIKVNFVNPGYISSQRSATFDATQSTANSNNNPYLTMSDAGPHNVKIVGGTNATVTRNSDNQITIAATDTNDDVNDTNLRAKLEALNPDQGIVYIGDTGNDLDLKIRGNLTVLGTQTIMNTETVTTHDNKIELNSNAASTPTEDAGIIVNRGSSTNAQIYWSEASDRWYHTYGDGGTAYVIPLPSESMSGFTIHDGDGTQRPIADSKEIKFQEGTTSAVRSGDDYIQINWTDTSHGSDTDPYDLTFAHKLTTRTDPALGSALLAFGGNFTAVTGVTTNPTGHVTAINTTQFTLPTETARNNGLLTMSTLAGLDGSATFSADQAGPSTFTVSLDLSELTDMTPDVDGAVDELILLDNSVEKRKRIGEIKLGQFVNDQGWTDNEGDITQVNITAGNGLTGSKNTTSGNHVQTIHVGAGALIDVRADHVDVDLNELSDMGDSTAVVGTTDYLPILDSGVQKKKKISTITLSDFDNDNGWTDNDGTVTSVGITPGTGLDVSNTPITTSGNISISLDLSDLTDMTATVNRDQDELILLDNGAERRKLTKEIGLSVFNNDLGNYGGFSTTDTFLSDVTAITDNTTDIKLVHTMSNAATHDIVIEAGSGITLTDNANNDYAFEISVNESDLDFDNYAHWRFKEGNGTETGIITSEDTLHFAQDGITTVEKTADDQLTISTPGTDLSNTTTTTKVTVASSTGNNTDILEATGSRAGVMTVAHHDKLDAIAPSAEVNQNAFSNLMANTYDSSTQTGINVAVLSADSKTDTFTIETGHGFTTTATSSSDSMTINRNNDWRTKYDNDNAYVGNKSKEYIYFDPAGEVKLYSHGVENVRFYNPSGTVNSVMYFPHSMGPAMGIKSNEGTGSNKLEIFAENTGNLDAKFIFTHAGALHVHDDITAFSSSTASDVKLKENIERVEGALDKVSQLDGVTFTWKRDGKESAGVIAQNVEEVLPSAVKEVETVDGEEINKHVDYTQLSALFIEAIKELKEENKLLRAEIESLKDINS